MKLDKNYLLCNIYYMNNGRKYCLKYLCKHHCLYNSLIIYSATIIYTAINTPTILAIVVFIMKIMMVANPKPTYVK
jgi:hypothetical protein